MNLEPLRDALQAETGAEVARERSDVTATCDRLVADAEARARALTERARVEGNRASEQEAARRRAVATRRAREIRLAARQRQIDELRRRSHDAVLGLRRDDDYPELVERLSRLVRRQLGDDALVEVDPAGVGGVIGRRGGVSVDYTLPAMADRVIDGMGEELEELWR